MRLLLTSAGVTNNNLADELVRLVGKTAEQTKVAVIPTAAVVEPGNKDWFLAQFDNLRRYGFNYIDIVDIAATNFDWSNRLNDVDVIFVSGGNTFYLLDQMRRSGFDAWLSEGIDRFVYVGASSGSIVVSPRIDVATIEPADPNYPGISDLTGLALVDFEIEPHCTGSRFAVVAEYSLGLTMPIYALDDESAVIVDGDNVRITGNGRGECYRNGEEVK